MCEEKKDKQTCERDEKPIIDKAIELRDAARKEPIDKDSFKQLTQELLDLVSGMDRMQLILGISKYSFMVKTPDDEYGFIVWAIGKVAPSKGVFLI